MRWVLISAWLLASAGLLLAGGNGAACADDRVGQTRTGPTRAQVRPFQFHYGASITGLTPGAQVRVWIPVAQSTAHQSITPMDQQLPATPALAKESKYGNQIMYFAVEAPASGEISFRKSYRVRRKEVLGLLEPDQDSRLAVAQRERFLAANSTVPIEGKPVELLRDVRLPSQPLEMARVLYDLVDAHVMYDKSRPGYGNGDSDWVCDSRYGNCTDFHSLFISLARSQGVPARFEIGFPLPPERGAGPVGGYHCWGFFYVEDHGWVPFDISEADKHPQMKEYYFGNLTENRLTLSTGRDIELVPRQSGPPLNFFVYPHVEVDGRPWPQEKLQLDFSFADE